MVKRILVLGLIVLTFCATLFAADVKQTRQNTIIIDILTGRVAEPANFNGWAGWISNDKGWQQLVSESFWTVDYTTGQTINTLASGLPKYNKDFTEMTVPLRKGILWNDGLPFNADDVVFSIEYSMAAPAAFANHTDFDVYVDSIKKTDDYTVVFSLKKANSRFHENFLDRWGAFRILPKHIWEGKDPMAFKNYPPVGTGPYTLVDLDKTGYWFIYKKRADWKNTSVGQQFGEPKPEYVQFQTFGAIDQKVMAQVQHKLDMSDLNNEGLKSLLAKSKTARGFSKDFPYAEIWHPCVTGVMFNDLLAPYDNPEVRWALNLCVDMVELTMTAYNGTTSQSPLYVPATLGNFKWYYDPMENWLKNELTIQVAGKAYKPFDASIGSKVAEKVKAKGMKVPTDAKEIKKLFGYGWWKFDPAAATALLEKNGFTKKEGKWYKPDGNAWKFNIIVAKDPAHPNFIWGFPLADQWRKFGIDCEATPLDDTNSLTNVQNFEVAMGWPVKESFGSSPDVYNSFKAYHSRYVVPIGEASLIGNGNTRWSNPDLDKIIEKMEKIDFSDPSTQKLTQDAIKIIVQQQPGMAFGAYVSYVGWDEYYWKGYPGLENPYGVPHYHWPNFQFLLPKLTPTGNK